MHAKPQEVSFNCITTLNKSNIERSLPATRAKPKPATGTTRFWTWTFISTCTKILIFTFLSEKLNYRLSASAGSIMLKTMVQLHKNYESYRTHQIKFGLLYTTLVIFAISKCTGCCPIHCMGAIVQDVRLLSLLCNLDVWRIVLYLFYTFCGFCTETANPPLGVEVPQME